MPKNSFAEREHFIVMKINSEPNDTTENGTLGKVIGSVSIPVVLNGIEHYGYTVIWDDKNDVPIAVAGYKLEVV